MEVALDTGLNNNNNNNFFDVQDEYRFPLIFDIVVCTVNLCH